jgi:hypothetical protein
MSLLGLRFPASDSSEAIGIEQLLLGYHPAEQPDSTPLDTAEATAPRAEDLRSHISRQFSEIMLGVETLEAEGATKELCSDLLGRLRLLSRLCIERSDPCGPVEPSYFATLIGMKSERALADIVAIRIAQAIVVHPELSNVSLQLVRDSLNRFCQLGVRKDMSIDEFAMRFSEFFGLVLRFDLDSPRIIFIEVVVREAVGLDGRIPNREFCESQCVANATRLVRALYRRAANEDTSLR